MSSVRVWAICLVAAWAAAGSGQPPAPQPGRPTYHLAQVQEGRKNKLGVYARTVANGAQILAVAPGSPASQAGLEPGDVVLSLDGFTVGYVDGVEYPLQSEVRRVKGVGKFKVRDWRTGEVVTKDIKLGDAPPPAGPPADGPPPGPGDDGPVPAQSVRQ